jgi:hypothetical protein
MAHILGEWEKYLGERKYFGSGVASRGRPRCNGKYSTRAGSSCSKRGFYAPVVWTLIVLAYNYSFPCRLTRVATSLFRSFNTSAELIAVQNSPSMLAIDIA